MTQPLVFDGHLDLAMSAIDYNRDITRPVADLRRMEPPEGHPEAGICTVSLPALAEGGVGVCMATLFARAANREASLSGWASPALARAAVQGQLGYYRTLERQGWVRIITSGQALQEHEHQYRAWLQVRQQLASGRSAEELAGLPAPVPPLGVILLMEGADPLLAPDDVEEWVRAGVRAMGLAHYGPNRYAHGTGSDGGLLPGARDILAQMEAHHVVLDTSHLADDAFWQALEHCSGRVMASHSNCRVFAPGNRQLTDAQIDALIQRNAVIGIVLETSMLAGERGRQGGREAVDLADVVDHIDHICQRAGSHQHVGLGSDLDGGFGLERVPAGIDTVADLHRLAEHLDARGYTAEQVADILSGNWLRFWTEALSVH